MSLCLSGLVCVHGSAAPTQMEKKKLKIKHFLISPIWSTWQLHGSHWTCSVYFTCRTPVLLTYWHKPEMPLIATSSRTSAVVEVALIDEVKLVLDAVFYFDIFPCCENTLLFHCNGHALKSPQDGCFLAETKTNVMKTLFKTCCCISYSAGRRRSIESI